MRPRFRSAGISSGKQIKADRDTQTALIRLRPALFVSPDLGATQSPDYAEVGKASSSAPLPESSLRRESVSTLLVGDSYPLASGRRDSARWATEMGISEVSAEWGHRDAPAGRDRLGGRPPLSPPLGKGGGWR